MEIFINFVTSVTITFSLDDCSWCCTEKIDIGHSFDLLQASMYLQSSYSNITGIINFIGILGTPEVQRIINYFQVLVENGIA